MGWVSCWGPNFGFPWFMLIMPILFLGMMFLFCRSSRGFRFMGCCGRHEKVDTVAELSALRREIEDLKKKLG